MAARLAARCSSQLINTPDRGPFLSRAPGSIQRVLRERGLLVQADELPRRSLAPCPACQRPSVRLRRRRCQAGLVLNGKLVKWLSKRRQAVVKVRRSQRNSGVK